jgi:hypothetical protein
VVHHHLSSIIIAPSRLLFPGHLSFVIPSVVCHLCCRIALVHPQSTQRAVACQHGGGCSVNHHHCPCHHHSLSSLFVIIIPIVIIHCLLLLSPLSSFIVHHCCCCCSCSLLLSLLLLFNIRCHYHHPYL